jgi:DNA polymerase-3 subunit epsilon
MFPYGTDMRSPSRLRGPIAAPRQRSFDDLDAPLYDVTFCAVDLETTGASARSCEIVEIGAVRSRGGESLGTFETFVRPRGDLPVEIQILTGIRPSMLARAEPLPSVLPSFLEFWGGAVFVAHNARFDHSFLRQACAALDYEMPDAAIVDTARLARRLLRDEVRNCRLHTLAAFFRTPHEPCHRAFADAAACLDVLHALLERAAAYGVTTLAELLALQRPSSGPHFEKVRLARDLPRSRGVYLFGNARGEVIYIGKATDLRARVRSYFVSDERKRIGDLLAEVASVRTITCGTDVEAQALEARLIERYTPRYNRRGVPRRAACYVKLTAERHPRFQVVTKVRDDGAVYVGPFSSRGRAQSATAVLASAFRIRTCTATLRDGTSAEPCPLYDLGSCHGPCTGRPDDVSAHDGAVRDAAADLAGGLIQTRERVAGRLARLAGQRRFEEAASVRDAFAGLVGVVERARTLAAIAASGRLELDTPEGPVILENGHLVACSTPSALPLPYDPAAGTPTGKETPLALVPTGLEERKVVAAWLDRARDVRIVATDRPLALPWPPVASIDRLDV